MEPIEKQVVQHQRGINRYQLHLGKYRVTRVEPTPFGLQMAMDLGQGLKFIVVCPPGSDVREGDLLTLYTEILSDAKPITPPEQ